MANVTIKSAVTHLFDFATSKMTSKPMQAGAAFVKGIVVSQGIPALTDYLKKKKIDVTDAKSLVDGVFAFAEDKLARRPLEVMALEYIHQAIKGDGLDALKAFLDSKGVNILEMKLPA